VARNFEEKKKQTLEEKTQLLALSLLFFFFFFCSKTLAIDPHRSLSLSRTFDSNPQIRLQGWRVFGSSNGGSARYPPRLSILHHRVTPFSRLFSLPSRERRRRKVKHAERGARAPALGNSHCRLRTHTLRPPSPPRQERFHRRCS